MTETYETVTSTSLLNALFDNDDGGHWREFDARYRPIVIRFVKRLGLRNEDAADVAQDALISFIKAYRNGSYDRTRGRLRNWLLAIVRNRVLDFRRAQAGRREVQGIETAEVPDESVLSDWWDTERRTSLLAQALDELKKTTRTSEKTLQVFEQYVLKQRPVDDVAAELGLTPHDVYMAKNRVAERLREILERLDKIFDDG